ncbi:alpha/beta fold hydrolase [Viridibacterium curvum]|uniref:Pimeloyl-ACP methyl ester esterase BioH n=1 Tax=Viridibacterium curvum TaxID=1101404 RepID=A0ABP9QD90_9RHOO
MNLTFLHGWGMRPGIWQGLQQTLGHNSQVPVLHAPTGSLDEWADAVARTLLPETVLIGWSLGAMLALTIAARHPRQVRALVLVAATPSFVKRGDWSHGLDGETIRAFREGFLRNPGRTLERFVALQAFGDAQRHAVTDALRAQLDDPVEHAAALGHGLRLLEESDLRVQRLPSVSLPCLLVHGAQDALIPASASIWLGQRWPGSETLLIEDAGHAPFLSAPQRVAEGIQRFLAART